MAFVGSKLGWSEDKPGWIVFQLGGREHYAVPRALSRAGRNVALVTDVWVIPKQRWYMPRAWHSRWHADWERKQVWHWSKNAVLREFSSRFRKQSMWKAIIQRNEWFEERAAKLLHRFLQSGVSAPPMVFSYSYAALRIFEVAKSYGCKCVLGQIDPGPEEQRLVERLHKKYGGDQLEFPPDSYWSRWRRECELADEIVVNSDWSSRLLEGELKSSEKLRVVPLAYETEGIVGTREAPRPQREVPRSFSKNRPLRILFLGQVILRKGVKELAAAIQQLGKAHVHWYVAGSGSQPLIDELRHSPNTVYLGSVPRDQVNHYYKMCDVFLLPTHSDGFALTQLEAAAVGMPIIASEHCAKVVRHGETGLLLADVSAGAIVNAINACLEPDRLRQMAESQHLDERFSLKSVGNGLSQLER